MNLDNFRNRMQIFRQTVDQEARELKEPYLALEKLELFYRSLSPLERQEADQVISEWVLSNDEALRFDALALIDIHRIKGAASSLSRLGERLAVSTFPGAPYELLKVRRILNELCGKRS
jgi:hypothetical protein